MNRREVLRLSAFAIPALLSPRFVPIMRAPTTSEALIDPQLRPYVPTWNDAGSNILLAIGDSLTLPGSLSPNSLYTEKLEERLNAPESGLKHRWRVINGGMHDNTMDQELQRLRAIKKLCAKPPQAILIQGGANNYFANQPLNRLEADLQSSIDESRQWNPQIRIMIGGMIVPPEIQEQIRAKRIKILCYSLLKKWRRPPPLDSQHMEQLGNVYRNIARRNQDVVLIDFFLDHVAGNPALNRDLFHPNERGHTVIAERVYQVFAPIARGLEQLPRLNLGHENQPSQAIHGRTLAMSGRRR